MSMDAITIDGLCRQLQQELSDSRVDKIFMPRREEVILSLRSRRGAWKLVISCSGAGGRKNTVYTEPALLPKQLMSWPWEAILMVSNSRKLPSWT